MITVDCAITAVEEVARARELGLDVVVTDHHEPRASGELPDAPIVHPRVGGYPFGELCAAGVAYKFAGALLAAAGRDPAEADIDLDIVALATIADCVPLEGENRRLVREGLIALSRTQRPGLRALLEVTQADPAAVDESTVAFRLAPRINAAGRLQRADAGVELLLTRDDARAAAIAGELDSLNAERRHVETRTLFEAEAQVAELGVRPAYVLAGEGWHPGVIGIVASRLAERHHRPFVLVALDGEQGTGSGRSIPAFDLLAGLDACAEHLVRHGGHRAAAGCTVERARIDAFRAAFEAHAASVLRPADLVPFERVDAVVSGDEIGLTLAEELRALAPYGMGNPAVSLLVPAARLRDARTMGEGKHLRFTLEAGGARAGAVAFGRTRLPDGHEDALDVTFGLEVNRWNGREEPRLVLRSALEPHPDADRVRRAAAGRCRGRLRRSTRLSVSPSQTARPPGRIRAVSSATAVDMGCSGRSARSSRRAAACSWSRPASRRGGPASRAAAAASHCAPGTLSSARRRWSMNSTMSSHSTPRPTVSSTSCCTRPAPAGRPIWPGGNLK